MIEQFVIRDEVSLEDIEDDAYVQAIQKPDETSVDAFRRLCDEIVMRGGTGSLL
jgi:hypothetical protein